MAPPHPFVQIAKLAAVGAASGVATLGGLGAVAYAQARRATSRPGEDEVGFWVDGRVGPDDQPPLRMVWLGDSLAAGLGAVAPDVTLPRLVAAGRAETVEIISYATPGATSADVVAHQLPALDQLRHGLAEIGQRIDAVGVSVGANDIAAFTSRRRLRRNVGTIVAAGEGLPMTFLSIPHLGDALRLPHPLRTFAAWRATWLDRALRAELARHDRVRYASVRRRPPWIGRRDRINFLSGDRFHPSGAGYAVWADRVQEAFDSLLAPSPTTT